ncbi:hypothetical protein ACQ4PT_062625 [Festuca glaucescens]
MANAMLGKWEAASRDLHAASNIDYDDEISAVLKKVEPNAPKIVEHRRKYVRLRKKKLTVTGFVDVLRHRLLMRGPRRRSSSGGASSRGGFLGGFPGFGVGMPGGMGMGGVMPGPGGAPVTIGMHDILNDHDLMAAFGDPEVIAALQDVMSNPANFAKHQSNSKVGPIIAKMIAKVNGNRSQ